MRFKNLLFINSILILTVISGSCRNDNKEKKKNGDTNSIENDHSSSISSELTDTLINQNQLITHFWDDFDFSNEEMYGKQGEQAIANFIGLFPSSSGDEIQNSVFSMLSKAEKNPKAFTFFQELYRKYLYDPNSPLRSDRYYESVLRYLTESETVSADKKQEYAKLLKRVQKNKEGTQASSFAVTLQSGEIIQLRDIESPLLLLVFYEPDCTSCQTIIRKMKGIPELNDLIDNKKTLKILAVYAVGNGEIWKDYFPHMPANWLNGIDKKQNIIRNNIYDLRASPTMYLLDQHQDVILKDTDLSQLMYFLLNNKSFR
ncbi:DUF5106 domain-containing protein [Sphingobacterium spiritivorum]|uniref:DUF5106 domain-containing protein n=1 Tax=Sphingobacterium spiritivorum TaxID=258 RepID=UPI003DA5379C